MKMPVSRKEIAAMLDELRDELRKRGAPEDVVKQAVKPWDSAWKALAQIYDQVEIIQGEHGALRRQSEELHKCGESLREIRRDLEELKKREGWPPPDPPGRLGPEPLRKKALPAPTHDEPDRIM